jgi:hypothetical protein
MRCAAFPGELITYNLPSFVRKRLMAWLCSWLTRDSPTPEQRQSL